MFVWFSGTFILLDLLELKEKHEFPSHDHDLDVNENVIHKLETGNYDNSDRT